MPNPAASPLPDDGYRCLDVTEVLADLPSLNREQLLVVKALEEGGERRGVILDRISDLLVVQEAADHLRAISTFSPPSPPPDSSPHSFASAREASPDLLEQMGGLLAKNAARTATASQPATWPGPPGPGSVATDPPGPDGKKARGPKARRGGKTGKAGPDKRGPAAPAGLIVPDGGRRLSARRRLGRVLKAVAGVVLVAVLAAGGVGYWMRTHKTDKTASAAVIVKDIPGDGYGLGGADGATGPTSLAQAAQASRDAGIPNPVIALAQAGYVNGYRELWTNTNDNRQITLVVYRFRSAAGATGYRQRLVNAARARFDSSVPGFPVPEISGAVGLGGATSGTAQAQLIFSRGAYLVSIVATNGTAAGVVREATLVAVVQYTSLLASQ